MNTMPQASTTEESLHECFKWIYHLIFYTGCLCFRLSGHHLRLSFGSQLYTNVIRIILLVGFIGGLCIKLSNEESFNAMLGNLTPVQKINLTFECVCTVVTYIEVTIIMDVQKRAHLCFAERFQMLDQRITEEFPCIRLNYKKTLRKYTSMTLSVIIFYFVVSLIYVINLAYCDCDVISTFVIAITYACLNAGPGVCGFLHMAAMDMLRLRFRLLCTMVNQLNPADKKFHAKQPQQCLAIVRIIEYYKNYTELILEINNVFGYMCAAGLFYDFGLLTNMVFVLCQKLIESRKGFSEYIFILLFMVPRTYKVLMTACYGHVAQKAKYECAQVIVSYGNYFPQSKQMQDVIRAYLHWKMHHNYDLTIGQIIRLNFNLAHMFLHGIINYVLVLIQLQFQQYSITNHLKHIGHSQEIEVINPAYFTPRM